MYSVWEREVELNKGNCHLSQRRRTGIYDNGGGGSDLVGREKGRAIYVQGSREGVRNRIISLEMFFLGLN